MLPKENRLKNRYIFRRTLGGKRLFIGPYFVLYAYSSRKAPMPQVGFIVSKKVHKRAVQRNRVKRQLRSLVRTFLFSEKHSPSLLSSHSALVFIARKPIVDVPFIRIHEEMQKCCQLA